MIVLGLDGATFNLIRPWVDSGDLPNFERLLDESVSGDLESTIPEITVPAWPAFATGRNPTELDMYGFTHFNRDTRENDLSHDDFVPGMMWDVVDDQGGSSVAFNIPGAYPWREISGSIIAAAPEYKDEFAHPPDRWKELNDLVDGYKLRNDKPPGSRDYVELSLELVDKRFDGFEHFIERDDPDLAVGLIRATDRVAHHYWGPDSTPPVDTPIYEVYERVDERLGRFLDSHADEDIVFMSDHGFEKVCSMFAPNFILEREGLVSLTDSGSTKKAAMGSVRDIVSRTLEKLGLLTLARKTIPESALTDIPTGQHLGLENAINLGRIDWDRTVAIAAVGQKSTLIYALSDDPADIEAIVARAKHALRKAAEACELSVRFEQLERGGPHTPDLAMVIETPEIHASSRFDVAAPLFDVDTSGHAREGILLARGPSFRDDSIDGAHITDIAPTVLHAMGYQIPRSMDGNVLDVFAEDSAPAQSAPDLYEFADGESHAGSDGIGNDREKEDEVKDRLRELGYLE